MDIFPIYPWQTSIVECSHKGQWNEYRTPEHLNYHHQCKAQIRSRCQGWFEVGEVLRE
jgi:hypothetical protein